VQYKRFHSDKHLSEFTYKMAAIINKHRYGTIITSLAPYARKTAKYAALECRYLFQPIAAESVGPTVCSAVLFLSGLSRRIAEVSVKLEMAAFFFSG